MKFNVFLKKKNKKRQRNTKRKKNKNAKTLKGGKKFSVQEGSNYFDIFNITCGINILNTIIPNFQKNNYVNLLNE